MKFNTTSEGTASLTTFTLFDRLTSFKASYTSQSNLCQARKPPIKTAKALNILYHLVIRMPINEKVKPQGLAQKHNGDRYIIPVLNTQYKALPLIKHK